VASGAAFALAGALLWLFIHPDRIVRIGDMLEDGP
jgi:hypothetical protein